MAAFTEGANRFFRAVTDLVFAEDAPERADVIFVPGSMVPDHAWEAARLYRAGYAPLVLPSGRFSVLLGRVAPLAEEVRAVYPDEYPTEYAFLRAVLLESGVPERAILREDRATFTWENALFSRQVTDQAGLTVRKAILCCKPWHARRALTYYQAAFPETRFFVCPEKTGPVQADSWFLTPEGRQLVLSEVARVGNQMNREIELLVSASREAESPEQPR